MFGVAFGLHAKARNLVWCCAPSSGVTVDVESDIHPTNQHHSVRGRSWASERKAPVESEPLGVQLYVMGSGSAGSAAIAVQMRPPPFVYWQASQSGLSILQASGTGAGFGSAAGAALAEFAASLPPLDTAFSLPVLMVDFSVLVAARARR